MTEYFEGSIGCWFCGALCPLGSEGHGLCPRVRCLYERAVTTINLKSVQTTLHECWGHEAPPTKMTCPWCGETWRGDPTYGDVCDRCLLDLGLMD